MLHFSQNFSNCSNTLKNCKTSRWHFWQIICDTPIIFCCITSHNRTDYNVFKNSLLFFPKTLILDRPLILKSILQILQKSLGTILVSFSGVFIPVICMKLRFEAKAKTRGFFSPFSPLRNSSSSLHGSRFLSPRKISRKPLGSGYELR